MPKRLRWWHLYLVALGLSQLWQGVRPTEPSLAEDQQEVEVAAQLAHGPAAAATVRIAYRESGQGQPVVYLHGSPGSGADSAHLAELLADRYRFLAPDLPGFGASSRWIPDYGIAAHGRYVLGFMDVLGIESAHLVGHSMGGGVAFEIARIAPERVRSIVSYAGIGVQEGEGSGDYYLEHLKYAVGYAAIVALPEVVPHFGLLGPRSFRHAVIRNFWDTDQRPLRSVLESIDLPLLLLQGRRDPLVPAWTAREHHRLVDESELVMMEASHFLVFSRRGSERLAEEIRPFLQRHENPEARPARRTIDFRIDGEELPTRLDLHRGLGPWTQIAAMIGATFVSEDLTCISAGLLARAGQVDFFVAVLGCFLGIFVSDIWLWSMGRLIGRRILHWRWIARRLPAAAVDRFGESFDRHIGKAVVASRFLPGTRLPMYVAAGIVSKRTGAFIVWLAVAAAIWTPILVLAALVFGRAAARPFEKLLGAGWPSWVAGGVLLFVVVRIVAMTASRQGRARLAALVSRLWRWEFWPTWLFYLPVLPWFGWLALRYGGITTPTATNPAQPHGGFVGESKIEILRELPSEWVQPSFAIAPGDSAGRLAALRSHARSADWELPIVLKPDEGQRGVGLKLVRSWEEVASYLEANPRTILAQTYHPGPYEAGIFYYRLPGETVGRIFSITDKAFPEIVGDGRSTLEQLILGHRRLRMQWKVFATRLAARLEEVPAPGERVRLALAGNHCQGTMFLDGAQLATAELEVAIDAVAREYEGFYFGRFDARYTSVEELRAGRGFRILELNGVTSESTNIYDPSRSMFAAYRTLYRQWALAFRIGHANRLAGHRASSIPELVRAALAHYRHRTADSVAD